MTQPLVARPADCAQHRRTEQGHKHEIVEVPGLERGILAIVREAKQLAPVPLGGRLPALHPVKGRARDKRRR